MSKLAALFSSSKANCILMSSPYANILIDFGASLKAVKTALENIGVDISQIDAVLITHEHTDHTKGLKTFTSKYKIPIISSKQTLNALVSNGLVSDNASLLEMDLSCNIGEVEIIRFCVSHDCVDPGGYIMKLPNGTSAAVCTDLGFVSDDIKEKLCGCDALLIESNHDLKMLNCGPYPPELKMRIASKEGHISNNTCAALLKELYKSGCTRFMLGHLSENNNTPILAQAAVESALMDLLAKNGEDYVLKVAAPSAVTALYF